MLKDLGKSIAIYGIAASLSKFIGIFLIPVFSRYFEQDEYGALDLIMTVVSLVAIFGMLQLESGVARFYYEADGLRRKLYVSAGFWTMFFITFLFTLGVFILAPYISNWLFGSEEYSLVIRFASTNILLFNIFGYLMVLIRFAKKPKVYALAVFLQFLLTFLISVILVVYYNFKIIAFFIGQIGGLVIGILVLLKFLRYLIIWRVNTHMIKELFYYSLPQVPATASKWVNTYANRFVMLGYLSVADIGIYTVAIKIASIFNLVDNAFRMAWAPFIFEQLQLENHKQTLKSLGLKLSIILFSIALMAMLFAEELVMILSTEEYLEAVPLIKILFFAFCLPVLVQVLGIGSSIAKRTAYITYAVITATAVNIGLLFVTVPVLGLIGVPISLASGNIIMLILRWYFSERHYFVGYNIYRIGVIIFIFSFFTFLILYFPLETIYKLLLLLIIITVFIYYFKKIRFFLETDIK